MNCTVNEYVGWTIFILKSFLRLCHRNISERNMTTANVPQPRTIKIDTVVVAAIPRQCRRQGVWTIDKRGTFAVRSVDCYSKYFI